MDGTSASEIGQLSEVDIARQTWITELQQIKNIPRSDIAPTSHNDYLQIMDASIKMLQSPEFLDYARKVEAELASVEGKTIFFDLEGTLTKGRHYSDEVTDSKYLYISDVRMFPVLWALSKKNTVVFWTSAEEEVAKADILPSVPFSLRKEVKGEIFKDQWKSFFMDESSEDVIQKFSAFGFNPEFMRAGKKRITQAVEQTGWKKYMEDQTKGLTKLAQNNKMPSVLVPLSTAILIDDAGNESIDIGLQPAFKEDLGRVISPPSPSIKYDGNLKMVQQITQAFAA